VSYLQSLDPQPAEHSAYSGLHRLINLAAGAVHSRHHQILEHFQIPALGRLRVDLHAQYLLAAVHFHHYAAASRGAFDHGLLELSLQNFVLPLGL